MSYTWKGILFCYLSRLSTAPIPHSPPPATHLPWQKRSAIESDSHYVRFIHPSRRIINSHWMKLSKVFGLSVASRLIICRGRKTRKIIYLQNTDKPRKFAITEFNNWFVTKFDFIFKPRCDSIGSNVTFFTRERGFNYAWAEYYLLQNTFRRYYAWANLYL